MAIFRCLEVDVVVESLRLITILLAISMPRLMPIDKAEVRIILPSDFLKKAQRIPVALMVLHGVLREAYIPGFPTLQNGGAILLLEQQTIL